MPLSERNSSLWIICPAVTQEIPRVDTNTLAAEITHHHPKKYIQTFFPQHFCRSETINELATTSGRIGWHACVVTVPCLCHSRSYSRDVATVAPTSGRDLGHWLSGQTTKTATGGSGSRLNSLVAGSHALHRPQRAGEHLWKAPDSACLRGGQILSGRLPGWLVQGISGTPWMPWPIDRLDTRGTPGGLSLTGTFHTTSQLERKGEEVSETCLDLGKECFGGFPSSWKAGFQLVHLAFHPLICVVEVVQAPSSHSHETKEHHRSHYTIAFFVKNINMGR